MAEHSGDKKNEIEINSTIGSISTEDKFSVSSILRRQRVSLGLSIEKIAGDLKINKTYVQALEDENYEAIPAEPYIRAYVKTIADFLSLDSEKLIKQLSEERTRKLGISSQEPATPEEQQNKDTKVPYNVSESKKNRSFGLIALLLLLLCILLYFGINKNETLPSSQSLHDNYKDALIGAVEEQDDSLAHSDSLGVDSLNVEPQKIELELVIKKDSTWIEVVVDGKRTERGFLKRSTIKREANDSINVYIGARNLWATEMQINGKSIEKENVSGYWTFTKDTAKTINSNEWQRLKKVN